MYDSSLLEVNDHAVKEAKRNCEKLKAKFDAEQYLDPVKAEEAKERGNKAYRDGNFSEAIKEYTESIKRDPKVAAVYLNRGLSFMKILDYGKALEDMDKSIELDPKYVKAYAKKGNIHYFLKQYHKATDDYNKGLELDPTNQECLEGKQKTQMAIYTSGHDEERAKRAMEDPEIRALMQDPRITQVLKDAQENPASLNAAMRDPFISQAIQRLVAAGVLGMK
jgi:stress-induced-phosphoprotein 1